MVYSVKVQIKLPIFFCADAGIPIVIGRDTYETIVTPLMGVRMGGGLRQSVELPGTGDLLEFSGQLAGGDARTAG